MSHTNKVFPNSLKNEILKALTYFPTLRNVPIEFKFKTNIKRSTMQAQPRFSKILSPRHKREYIIFIKTHFNLGTIDKPIEKLPKDVLVGWFGHELGHIMDYEQMSNFKLIRFGLSYLISNTAIVNAERQADTFAIKQGMQDYIIKTKNFILEHADISESYKNRMKKYYLSPEEIMEMVTQ
ncbi:hypothetical protein [Mesohalobacter halotolerans]|uniref:hypothetical protein n=1 Tax=Mesohalobacter halotolerans TaxID=1883405 RepID=UPI001FEAB043|nr:hypothetical protein [Mesohalobacter halotolerans]